MNISNILADLASLPAMRSQRIKISQGSTEDMIKPTYHQQISQDEMLPRWTGDAIAEINLSL